MEEKAAQGSPPSVNEVGLNRGCLGCLLYQQLLRSTYYEPDPSKADFYWIPGGGKYASRDKLLEVFHWMRAEWPWWNQSVAAGQARHVFLSTYDSGPGETLGWKNADESGRGMLPDDMNPFSPTRNVVFLSFNSLRDVRAGQAGGCTVCMQAGKDIMIPTAENVCGPLCGYDVRTLREKSLWSLHGEALQASLSAKRKHTLFFGGSVGDLSENDYTGRGGLVAAHADRPGFNIVVGANDHGHTAAGAGAAISFAEAMRDAEFCYSPMGSHGGDSDRYVAASLFGCVPVLINSSHNRMRLPHSLPLEEVLPWHTFSSVVDTADVATLHEKLECLLPSVPRMRAALAAEWPRLLYSSLYRSYLGEPAGENTTVGGGQGDAFDAIMQVLTSRIPHGYRASPEAMARMHHADAHEWPCRARGSAAAAAAVNAHPLRAARRSTRARRA
ncbi:hypothetical protein FOA52_007078 [Chlamydomonas sp. UWO 241]|nr:hypothetical protein FOA52_007078 [Chlamydomonas sp. UWO 241]